MIKLGVKGRDKLTGFEGVVYGRAEYLTGCDQYCLVPRVGEDGDIKDSRWFDEGRIEIIGSGILQEEVSAEKPGGPNLSSPKGVY